MTALGVVIGVASVIAIATMVEGLSRQITHSVDDLGTNSLTVRAYTPFDQQLRGRINRLGLHDYEVVRRAVDRSGTVTPTFAPFGVFGSTVRSERTATATKVLAVTADYQEATKVYVAAGRFLSPGDLASRRRVCVLGAASADRLRLSGGGIGRFVQIGEEWFKVIGLMQERGEVFGISQDDFVLIPFSVGVSLAGAQNQQDLVVTVNVAREDEVELVAGRIRAALTRIRSDPGTDGDTFKVQTAKQLRETVVSITSAIALALVGVVAISVLVGGIGIMNIMLVSVTERTREIGICKALGARRQDIMSQFLLEAMLISSLGGGVGFLAGESIAFAGSFIIPYVSVLHTPAWAVLLALAFSIGTGIVFGTLPAIKAANLRPIDALRYE